jgi:hypothetical protein
MLQSTWGEWTRRPSASGTEWEDVPVDELPFRLVSVISPN